MSFRLVLALLLLTIFLYRGEAVHAKAARSFVFGIPRNINGLPSYLKVIITTTSRGNVGFNYSINGSMVESSTVNATHSFEVEIDNSMVVLDSFREDRNKSVTVEAAGDIEVTAYNSYTELAGSIGAFRVMPHNVLPALDQYKYIGMSTRGGFGFHSLMLLVGCEDDTVIYIRPSTTIQLPQDIQNGSTSDNITTIAKGERHKVVLHHGQTLLLKSGNEDLTGTEVTSNKPLTVISGHECGRLPIELGGCDQLLTQIPPTVTWGKDFILLPLSGRTSGHIYKVITSQNETMIYHNCNNNNMPDTRLLLEGEVMEFRTGSYKSCHLRADKPIIVAQFSLGEDTDRRGDPTLSIVPPIEQYVHQISFKSLAKGRQLEQQYMNIIVPSDCFHHTYIKLDGKSILCEWSLVYSYDSSTVLGYTCKMPLEPNTMHTLTHTKDGGHMTMSLYGFATGNKRQGYSYYAGFAMQPLNAVVKVHFSASSYRVMENDEYLLVDVHRMDDVVSSASVTLTTKSGHAYPHRDFIPLEQKLLFQVGEKRKTVKIYIVDDDSVEVTENFKLHIQPDNPLSSSTEATVEIIDNDGIQIGFSSPQSSSSYDGLPDDDERKSFIVEILNGSFPEDDDRASILLSLEIVDSSDMASPSLTEPVLLSPHNNRSIIPYTRRNHDNDDEVTSLVGFLRLIDASKVNKSKIDLRPSVSILHILPTISSSSVMATPTPTSFVKPPEYIESSHAVSNSTSISTIVIVATISCFCTAVIVILLALIGCFLSYKYGQNNDFRYQYFRRKTPPRETYVVHSVIDTV